MTNKVRDLLLLIDPALRARLTSGAIWSITGAGLASGFTMLSNVACARALGAKLFGELAIVLSTTNLFTSLFTSGVGMTAAKFVAEHRDSAPGRAGMMAGLSWVTSAVVGVAAAAGIAIFAPILSAQVLGERTLSLPLRLGGIVMFFAALNGAQMGALSGLEAFRPVAASNLIRGAGILVLVTAGAVFGDLRGALIGYAAAGALATLYLQIAVRREFKCRSIPISYRFGREEARVLVRFTLPVLVTTFSFTPAAWWSNVILATTSGYAQAGIFNAVLHWQYLILFFSNAIANIGLPILSNIRSERDPAKYKRCLAATFLLTTAPAAAIALPVAIFARFILHFYGQEFIQGTAALVLISIASVLTAFNIPVGHAIWSLNAARSAIVIAAVRSAILVVSAYALAGRAATGLGEAYLFTALIQTAISIPFTSWLVKSEFKVSDAEEVAVA